MLIWVEHEKKKYNLGTRFRYPSERDLYLAPSEYWLDSGKSGLWRRGCADWLEFSLDASALMIYVKHH